MPRQRTIICQQQQAFGVVIQSPNRHHTWQVFRQQVEYRLATIRIVICSDAPGRFVKAEHPGRLRSANGFPVDAYAIERLQHQRR
jgi:hypothetical protein